MKLLYFIFKFFIFSIIILFASSYISSNKIKVENFSQSRYPEFIKYKNKWVDSVFQSLSLDDKIAQLIMVAAYSNKGDEHKKNIENLIQKHNIGGLIFFQGGPVRQANLTNYYQSISKTPLLIAMDAEWGLSMRLDSVQNFPLQMMLGAIQNNKWLYDLGVEIGEQCNRLGVHVNFAPVIDINNNPANPVINSRSFGEDRVNVAEKGFAYMFGLQEKKIIATAKHFPGHGDTDSDSHKTLPIINHSFNRLDSIELFPFKYLIDRGLAATMIAHLHIPALDSAEFSASSLSKNVVTDLLINDLGFKGLIFTDALGMKGVSNYNSPGTTSLKAFLAGVDILLMPDDVNASISAIKNAVESGLISKEEIDRRCLKVLKSKQWVGLENYKPIKIDNLTQDLNSSNANLINRKLIENSLTLVKNNNDLIPIKNLDSVRIASVSIGYGGETKFQESLSLYDNVTHFSINKNASLSDYNYLLNKLSKFDLVIAGFHNPNRQPKSFGLTKISVWFAHELSKHTKVILDIFASPYTLSMFKPNSFNAIILSYEDTDISQDLSAQLIFGGVSAQGKLPVSAGKYFLSRMGEIDKKIRLKYAPPIELNINELKLKKIDSIVLSAIDEKVMPGCQILAIKNGTVFYQKSFGYHTYDKKLKVKNDDIYDIASLTKITATIPAIMKLSDEGKIDINKKLSYYLSELDSTNKKDIIIKQILAHQAKLKAWIPFYLRTYDKKSKIPYKLNPEIYTQKSDEKHQFKVAEKIFISNSYTDTMYKQIIESPLRTKSGYRYSDLGFYLFYKMIENQSKYSFTDFLDKNFYKPIGLTSTTYNPLNKYPLEKIIPTEKDNKFRKQLIQGYVHDYGAAMMGGISGHAGLFSNSNDLAKLMQMFLQKGEYGGRRYLNSSTVALFTKKAYSKSNNRRALGFDRPGSRKKSPVSNLASSYSFGHTGFTGTMAWVDPKEDFIYIFLSNRVYPNAQNNKLVELNIRSKIQSVFYQSFN
ncbi:MAG: serine hydrolase [Bacteroidales bacterium]|nr:serine hydrolase [Bacteroidales bacterium]MBN2757221.1 serine hydrolase [Bacteroidales bacterium]